MRLIWRIQNAIGDRLRSAPDRGDSPIPSTIIIAGLAVIAIALLAWLGQYVLGFLNEAPTDLPDPPF
jgi:hypothetical protein